MVKLENGDAEKRNEKQHFTNIIILTYVTTDFAYAISGFKGSS